MWNNLNYELHTIEERHHKKNTPEKEKRTLPEELIKILEYITVSLS